MTSSSAADIKTLSKETFTQEVFPKELEEIKRRRNTARLTTDSLEGEPSVERNIVGLAISGGGIRSATFSLGVVQGLAQRGLLKAIDYLSTVSGGGYTGSCLSSLLNDPKNKTNGDDFPLRYTTGSEEPISLTHLRNSSNYLSPGGLLHKLRLPNILLRGILLNLFIFMPFIMAAVIITEVAYERGPHWDGLISLLLPLSLVFFLMSIAFPLAIRLLRRTFDWDKRNTYELWLTIPLLLAIIIVLLTPILSVTRLAIEHSTGQFLSWVGGLDSNSLWISGATAAGIVILFMLVGKASEHVANWSGKLLLSLVGLLGPALVFFIYLGLCLWQVDSPYLSISATSVLNEAVACEEPCLYQKAQQNTGAKEKQTVREFPDNLFPADDTVNTFAKLVAELQGRSITVGENSVIRCMRGDCERTFAPENWRQDNRIWVINGAPHLQEHCPSLEHVSHFENAGIAGNCHYLTRDSRNQLRIEGDQLQLFQRSEDFVFFGLFIGLLLFNRFFLDMNMTSMHGFYRDRLSKAYLFNVGLDNELVHNDKLKLSDLNAAGSVAPYHLINVALNLQASKDADLRGRKSDFFLLSKHYIGSDRTGYTETKKIEKYDKHLDLGTAMAISGGAAAPNMGSTTNRSLVFIMTLLNIRLGYWLPNPRVVNTSHWLRSLNLSGAKPNLIWREALGNLNAKGSHINISDGGHIENLGIYPLLKRRCKYIVAIDGEADPTMTFEGLVKLMRFARIDMGIKVDIDLENLRKDEHGLSRCHWTTGDLHYGDGETGKLLYIKLSVTGEEPEYVRAYRSENPLFPHEPTSNQFFTEDQFEAYRALGSYACRKVFENTDAISEFAALCHE